MTDILVGICCKPHQPLALSRSRALALSDPEQNPLGVQFACSRASSEEGGNNIFRSDYSKKEVWRKGVLGER